MTEKELCTQKVTGGGSHTYDFKGNVTIDGSKLNITGNNDNDYRYGEDNTDVIDNKGKDNLEIKLGQGKTMEVSNYAGNIIKATSTDEKRTTININDKNNKKGNLVFKNGHYREVAEAGGIVDYREHLTGSQPGRLGHLSSVLADNSDVNIYAETLKIEKLDKPLPPYKAQYSDGYHYYGSTGLMATNSGKVNVGLSGNFEVKDSIGIISQGDKSEVNVSTSGDIIMDGNYSKTEQDEKNVDLGYTNIIAQDNGKVNLQANKISLTADKETITIKDNGYVKLEGNNIEIIKNAPERLLGIGGEIIDDNYGFMDINNGKLDIISNGNVLLESKVVKSSLGQFPMLLKGNSKVNIQGKEVKILNTDIRVSDSSELNIKGDSLYLGKSGDGRKVGIELELEGGKTKIETNKNEIKDTDISVGYSNTKSDLSVTSNKNIISGNIYVGNKGTAEINFDGIFDESGRVSSFTGKTKVNKENGGETLNLGFSNGARWNVINRNNVYGEDWDFSSVTNLTLNNGIVDFDYDKNTTDLIVENLKGNKGTFILDVSGNDTNHEKKETDFIDIKNADKEQLHYVQIGKNSIENLNKHDFEDGKKGIWFADADKNVTFEGKEFESLSSIYDYDIIVDKNLEGRDPSTNGNNWYITNLVEKENETITSAKENMAFLYQAGISRLEVESMHERMGEIRNYENNNGVWFKTSSGKMSADNFGNDYNLLQVGYDKQEDVKGGKIFTGIAVNRRQNKLDLTAGDGESENVGVSLYKSFAGNDGKYFDVLAKTTYIDTDYKISNGTENMNADYNTWAETLSMEVGKKYSSKTDKWYVTPHAQINYSFIKGDDYTTNTNINVKQGDINSLIGKVGIYAGKDFEKSSHYIKVAGLYEALGDYRVDMNDQIGSKSYSDKLDGKDSWAEIGIGGTFQIGNSGTTHMYYNIERTLGSEYETQWEGTLGIRMTF